MTMNNNTESTSNSIKFAPMPMSALLANLMPLQTQSDTPDLSFTTDESDDSFSESVENKKKFQLTMKSSTPQYKVSKENKFKSTASEGKISKNDDNKENYDINQSKNEIFSNKDVNVLHSDLKLMKTPAYSNADIKIVNVLKAPDNNAKIYNKCNSAHKKTPELPKVPSSCHKTRTCTPKIKSGIRKFTPGSARQSQKKTPQQMVIQNRDKVRCELFRHNQKKDEPPQAKPAPVVIVSEHIQKKNEPPLAKPAPVVMVPVPETPMNRKPMPASYAATPSYPQGVVGNNSKILFKTTCIKDKKYMFIKKLGTGGSSEVYKVLEVRTSSEYAVKCVYLATDQELAQGYINEVRLLRELQNSDRVVRLYDYEYDRENQFLRMVLEVGETDLSSFLRARGAGLPPALVVHYWEEMLHAVNYIHEHGVIHADLKPANFLLVCGRLKLIDFGIASAISGDATSVVRAQAAGTYSYISPEALMGGAGGYGGNDNIKISFRSDVWSLGCILYSMIYGRTPFGHIPNLAKLAAILDPNHRIDYPPTDHLPQTLISTLKWCLTYNARSRPSVRELLSVRHLQPARALLPADLLERLRPHVSSHDYTLLQQAQI